ncbi:hypothetical protein ABIA33_007359 [Streptacidiphilus sp. MAP12-16]|uniref:RICIN domain-containing protein n=1 Tax=Streptacidiphilus sp. MAP12-16 TaxID=3156300 RepID=UPI0035154A9C
MTIRSQLASAVPAPGGAARSGSSSVTTLSLAPARRGTRLMMQLLRRLGSAAAAIGLVVGLGVAGGGTAHAATDYGYWQYGHVYTFVTWYQSAPDSCLDDSNGGGTRTFGCNNLNYQKWKVINLSSGYAQLENLATGRCLDWSPQYGLRTFGCYPSSFNGGWQMWARVHRTSASGGAEEVLQNGRWQDGETWQCLDDSQYGVRGYPCNGPSQDAGYQGWTVIDVT